MKIKLTSKRQLTIPKKILDEVNFSTGPINIHSKDGFIILKQEKEEIYIKQKIENLLKENNYHFNSVEIVSEIKEGFISKTFLVNIDGTKYIFKEIRNVYQNWGMSLDWRIKEFCNVTGDKMLWNDKNVLINYKEGKHKRIGFQDEKSWSKLKVELEKFWNHLPENIGNNDINFIINNAPKKQITSIFENIYDNEWKKSFDLIRKNDKLVFCHGDISMLNIIWDKKPSMIDFDYVGMSYKRIDLASLIIFENDLHKIAYDFWKFFFENDSFEDMIVALEACSYKWIYNWNSRNDKKRNEKYAKLYDLKQILESVKKWKI